MAEEIRSTKVRLVRCPKCRLVLVELPDIQVYKCGGCATILQAKNRVNDLRSRSVGLNGTVAAQMNGLGHSSEDKASSSSGTSSQACSSDQIDEKNRSKSSREFSDDRNAIDKDESKFSEGSESSSARLEAKFPALEIRSKREESNSSDGIESSSSSPKAEVPESEANSMEGRYENDESKSSEAIAISSSPKARTSDLGECSLERHIESGNSRSTFPDSGEWFLDHNNAKQQDKIYEDDKISVEDNGFEQLGELNLPNENKSNQNGYGEPGVEPLGVSRGIEVASSENKVSLPITAASFESLEDDKNLPSEPNLEVDIAVEIDSDSKSSSRLNAVATRDSISSEFVISSPDEQSNEIVDFNADVDSTAVNAEATRKSTVTDHTAQESSSSGALTSSPNEHHIYVPKSFDHLESSNTYENTEFRSPRSEFSAAVRDRSKSPDNRIHHAYDGSVSSYEGIDDQFYNHDVNTFRDAYNAPILGQSDKRYRKERFLAEIMGSNHRDSVFPSQARSSWLGMSDKNDHDMRYRNHNRDQMLPPRIPVYQSRDPARVQGNEYMPRMASSHQGGFLGGYGNAHFTNQMHNDFQSNSDYQSDRAGSVSAEEMTLLRQVYELQNQISSLNVQANRREQHIPLYHNYESSEEFYHDLNLPRDLRSSRAESHYSQQPSQYRLIPFSSEATTSRHQVDPSFMHHYPQDRQFSTPLPLPIRSNTNASRSAHPGYASSQWGSETMSDDTRHNSHEVKYYGEKKQTPKRHCRPIAGAAPILICYKCLKPLQIPADFLTFKRKCHRLRCGACLKVLEFSLHKRTCIVPYGVNPTRLSEVGDYRNGVKHPSSRSDDYGYGVSYYRSSSTEAGEHAGNVAPSNTPQNTIVHERNMSYNNATRGTQEIVFGRSQSQKKDIKSVERFKSARTSSHNASEKERPAKSSSPLHRLMGYRSPSQVIRGIGFSRSGSKTSGRN